MKKYTTNGCRSVTAENMTDAAEIFAARLARKKYGKSGYARTCAIESHSHDGTLGEYSAFLGYTPAGKHNAGTTVGSNVRFRVRLIVPPPPKLRNKNGTLTGYAFGCGYREIYARQMEYPKICLRISIQPNGWHVNGRDTEGSRVWEIFETLKAARAFCRSHYPLRGR